MNETVSGRVMRKRVRGKKVVIRGEVIKGRERKRGMVGIVKRAQY